MLVLESPTIMYSLSDTEVMAGISPMMSRSGLQRRRSTNSVDSTHSDKSCYSTKRKGVKYGRDGSVVCCRFCEILRSRDEDFLYEDDLIAVFRPLSPVVESHILVVPRCHIRNVNMLTKDHVMLLSRMKQVAEMVLHQMPQPSSKQEISAQNDADYKFAFHTPPFNSIDHVHMHAFRKNEGSFGCFGSIKYKTETWWCRSFDQVVTRLGVNAIGHDSHTSRTTSDEATSIST